MNLEDIKVGMRVIINPFCDQGYWGVRGVVHRIEAEEYENTQNIYVKFDAPIWGGTLDSEYFYPEELDKL